MERTKVTWHAMIARCYDVFHKDYSNYGARGIKVCDRWRIYEHFLVDMGERPEGKTIDRWPDKTGNYTPTNCRWATSEEQNNNQVRGVTPRWDSVSQIVGVSWYSPRKTWMVRLGRKFVGYYDNLLDAAAARKSAELK